MKHKKLLFVLITILALLLASCGGEQATPAPAEEEPAQEEPAEEPAAEEEMAEEEELAEEEEAAEEEMPAGEDLQMVLLPKFLGILVFDQAYEGALEAAGEIGNPDTLEFLGPTPENSVAGQIEIVTTAAT